MKNIEETAPAAGQLWNVPVTVERVIRVKTTITVEAVNPETARRLGIKAMRRVSTVALAMLPGSCYSPAPEAGDPTPAPRKLLQGGGK